MMILICSVSKHGDGGTKILPFNVLNRLNEFNNEDGFMTTCFDPDTPAESTTFVIAIMNFSPKWAPMKRNTEMFNATTESRAGLVLQNKYEKMFEILLWDENILLIYSFAFRFFYDSHQNM